MPEAASNLTPMKSDFPPLGSQTRRTLLAGLASGASVLAVLAPTAAAAEVHPDAALIAMAAEYVAAEANYARTCWAEDDLDDRPGKAEALAEFRAADAKRDALGNAIIDAVPVTIEGYRAKARAVVADFGNDFQPDGVGGAVLWSIVCDLLPGEA